MVHKLKIFPELQHLYIFKARAVCLLAHDAAPSLHGLELQRCKREGLSHSTLFSLCGCFTVNAPSRLSTHHGTLMCHQK